MQDFKNILFPVDLSETSPLIVPHVRMVAEKFEAQVHLLFAARLLEFFTSIYVPHPSVDHFEKEIAEGADRKLQEFRQEHFGDYPRTCTAVIVGDIAEVILTYVREQKIDLLIMGTHGRKGLDRVVFGSIAQRVVQMSPVPVLVINPYRTL
jgi:nucleotide-binding universal stress UspA family protein